MPAAMATRYITSKGSSIQLGARIGSGGEGHVFECIGLPDQVAKIYHRPPAPEHARKLQAMASMFTPGLEQIAAWPSQTISPQPNGQISGVLMKRIRRDFREIINLYNPNDRKKYFSNVDFSFLAHTAWNLAAAFETMHKAGVVIGDVNQKNILVNPQAFIRLIDCDSFQVIKNGEKFRCRVGVPDYTPPELQGKNFAQVDRSQNHDNFGLAVIIFSLLMMGRHPFAGVAIGHNPIDLTQAIQGYHFAYATKGGQSVLAPPPNAPPIDLLPGRVIKLFEAAFSQNSALHNNRPSSEDWLKELDSFRSTILNCPRNGVHKFGQHRSSCPWCEFESRAIIFFCGTNIPGGGSNTPRQVHVAGAMVINQNLVAELRTQLAMFAQLNTSFLPKAPSATGTPLSANAIAARRAQTSVRICLVLFVLCFCSGLMGSSGGVIYVIYLIWWLIEESTGNAFTKEKIQRKNAYDAAFARLQETLKKDEARQQSLPRLRGTIDNTQKLVNEYHTIPARFEDDNRKLETQKRAIQEKLFLQRFTIDAASIPNFGPNRKATLRSFGLYTAADIEKSAISAIPGIGEALQDNLMIWREQILAGFKFDPTKPIPQSETDALRMKYSSRSSILETELKARNKQLSHELSRLEPEWTMILAEHAQVSSAFAQAKADLEAMK